MKKETKKAERTRRLRHMAGLFDDLSFFYKATGDDDRSKGLKKAARKLRRKK
jgi:hypothetical protein